MVSFELGEELRKMFFRLVTSVSSKLTICTIPIKNITLSTLLILEVYRTCVELRNRPRSPKSLCGSVVEHRSTNPKVWGSIPHGDSEFFFIPRLWQDEKTSSLIYTVVQTFAVLQLTTKLCFSDASICTFQAYLKVAGRAILLKKGWRNLLNESKVPRHVSTIFSI